MQVRRGVAVEVVAAETLDRADALRRVSVGEAGWHRLRAPPGGFDRGDCPLELGLRATADRNTEANGREEPRRRLPDPGTVAGDAGDAVVNARTRSLRRSRRSLLRLSSLVPPLHGEEDTPHVDVHEPHPGVVVNGVEGNDTPDACLSDHNMEVAPLPHVFHRTLFERPPAARRRRRVTSRTPAHRQRGTRKFARANLRRGPAATRARPRRWVRRDRCAHAASRSGHRTGSPREPLRLIHTGDRNGRAPRVSIFDCCILLEYGSFCEMGPHRDPMVHARATRPNARSVDARETLEYPQRVPPRG